MQLKLYLNKFLKVDNIEQYSLGALTLLRNAYDEFLKQSKGSDPDFPLINFGGNDGEQDMKFSRKNNKVVREDDFGINLSR